MGNSYLEDLCQRIASGELVSGSAVERQIMATRLLKIPDEMEYGLAASILKSNNGAVKVYEPV
jgi:hypothetical protein